MSLVIRAATLQDVDQVVPLFDAYRQFYGRPSDLQACHRFLSDRLAAGESHVLLAGPEQGGPAVGFAQLYPSFSSIRCRPTLVLNDLYVAASARGLGLGRQLLDAARALARRTGAATISLQTAADNRQAQGLYERYGFVRDDHFLTYQLELP